MTFCSKHENQLRAFLESYLPPEGIYAQATRYALFSGGKRLRPWCALALFELYGYTLEKFYPFAASLECIHTYSLIHDDLPCMDNDGFRRGRPTLHIAYDEATALMSGSLLLTLAFEIIAKTEIYTFEERNALSLLLSIVAGGQKLLLGQLLDLEKHSSCKRLFSLKTGALFAAALKGSAIICNLTQDEINTWESIGDSLGILYQVVDDIEDEDSPFSHCDLVQVGKECYTALMEEFVKIRLPQAEKKLHSFANHLYDTLKEKNIYASSSII